MFYHTVTHNERILKLYRNTKVLSRDLQGQITANVYASLRISHRLKTIHLVYIHRPFQEPSYSSGGACILNGVFIEGN